MVHRLRAGLTVCGLPREFIDEAHSRDRWFGVTCPDCLSGQERHEPPTERNSVHMPATPDAWPERWRGSDFGPMVAVTVCGVIAPGGTVSDDARDISCLTCLERWEAQPESRLKVEHKTSTFHFVRGGPEFRTVCLSTTDKRAAIHEFGHAALQGVPAVLFESRSAPGLGEGIWQAIMVENQ